MTPDQLTIVKWGGGMLGGLIVGSFILLSWRGDKFEERQALAQNLGQEYEKLYPAEGMDIEEATKKWQTLKDHQRKALEEAESSMVPVLPHDYLESDLSPAQQSVLSTLKYLKQKAERTQVKIPSTLPFEEGLNADVNARLLQLAQLYLYREAIDACMDAGVKAIKKVKVESGPCDPQGKYAVMLCELELDATWDRTSQLLADFNQLQNTKGVGIRGVKITHLRSGSERLELVVSLLTANNPAWNLRADSVETQLPRTGTGGSTPTGTNNGSRFGRFGGSEK